MSNEDFFNKLLIYWKPTTVTFKMMEENKWGLYVGNDTIPRFEGKSFTEIITQVRILYSEFFITADHGTCSGYGFRFGASNGPM